MHALYVYYMNIRPDVNHPYMCAMIEYMCLLP